MRMLYVQLYAEMMMMMMMLNNIMRLLLYVMFTLFQYVS